MHEPAEDESPLLSAMQCKKHLEKAKGWFLVNVMHVLEEEESPKSSDKPKDQPPRSEKPCELAASGAQDRKRLISEAKLKHLLGKYKQVFKDLPDGLPPDRGIHHTIHLTENKTPFKHPYRLSPKELAEAKKQIAN